ncbi:TetR/AcrR family transcriptional regulator [Actinokineospora auranticolor]|uniref:AcrR family transcriptional regulator n=1 Tax=Actinokineospora auranticolor TaxID=155976 RepID=A0A2S6H219_9PSEU|nr:TetR/AcrR family transcriptional regulator [Actinokineospora auranticolor]PPK71470.1 AcrR family transcriptional regulator [Actinokineospora auranticolor]
MNNAPDDDTHPRRADARRNRARILEAATHLLAEHGVSVSFDEIARQAEVGVGTVYRHFPTREHLFNTVVTWGMRHLTDQARDLLTSPNPADAFFHFYYLMIEQTLLNKALCEAFENQGGERLTPLATAETAFDTALANLLAQAQTTSHIRDDLATDDVRQLVVAAATATRTTEPRSWRLARLIGRSLLPDPATYPVPEPDVTKFATQHKFRYIPDPEPTSRHETPGRHHCPVCGTTILANRVGRPAKYCGPACRQRAHRTRTGAGL